MPREEVRYKNADRFDSSAELKLNSANSKLWLKFWPSAFCFLFSLVVTLEKQVCLAGCVEEKG